MESTRWAEAASKMRAKGAVSETTRRRTSVAGRVVLTPVAPSSPQAARRARAASGAARWGQWSRVMAAF